MLAAVRRVAVRSALTASAAAPRSQGAAAAWACARPAQAAAVMPAAAPARWIHAAPAARFAARQPNEAEVPALLKRVVFDGFEHKLPRTSIYSMPSAGLDSTTGKPLADVLRVDSTAPLAKLGLDSLDLVELMVAVEREFHIELKDEEHDAIKNLGDIVTMIHEHPRAY